MQHCQEVGLTLKFHLSGRGLGMTLSYPMEMRVPSLRSVISISMSTGSWKKDGHCTTDTSVCSLADLADLTNQINENRVQAHHLGYVQVGKALSLQLALHIWHKHR